MAYESARAELEAARSAKAAADAAVTSGRHERELLAERWATHAAALQRLERARARLAEIASELEAVAHEREVASGELQRAAERLEQAKIDETIRAVLLHDGDPEPVPAPGEHLIVLRSVDMGEVQA